MTIEHFLSLPVVVWLRWLVCLLALAAYLFIVVGNWRLAAEQWRKQRANDATPTESMLSGSTGFLLLHIIACPLVVTLPPEFTVSLAVILVFLDPLALFWLTMPFNLLWAMLKWLLRRIKA